MKTKSFSFLILSQLVAIIAHAGWSSGGGEIFKDSNNPWFLNNVTTVRYCIALDEKNFGAPVELVSNQIDKAIKYWQNEFKFVKLPNLKAFGQVKIASQNFEKVSCDKSVDIRFQMGLLSKKQIKFLRNPKRYGAVSVRTDYSEKTLRGRGFVYVSPARGPLSYDMPDIPGDIWTKGDGAALYLVLLHELGHVFGLPHMGSNDQMMAETFVEKILGKTTDPSNWIVGTSTFFRLNRGGEPFCLVGPLEKLRDEWVKVLGLNQNQTCLKVIFDHKGDELMGGTAATFYAGPTKDNLSEVGSAKLTLKPLSLLPVHTSVVWLTDKQEVFPAEDLTDIGFKAILGPSLWSTKKYGSYVSTDGKINRSLVVLFEQGKRDVKIDGTDNEGEIVPLHLLGL